MINTFTYCCDGGSLLLGNETSRYCFPNGYGDGEFKVTVRDLESKDYGATNGMDWLGTVEGDNVHVYYYDCLRGDELTDESNILYTLPEGRWAVYANNGNMVLTQWD